jgi:bifunctional DNase/RNase
MSGATRRAKGGLVAIDLELLMFLRENAVAWARFRESNGDRVLAFEVGLVDGSILYYLLTKELPAPLPHELLSTAVTLLKGSIQAASVDDYDANRRRHVCHFDLKLNGHETSIDCRSSDVYSIAVAANAPCFAADHLLSQPVA